MLIRSNALKLYPSAGFLPGRVLRFFGEEDLLRYYGLSGLRRG